MAVWNWSEFWIVANGEEVVAVLSSEEQARMMVVTVCDAWRVIRCVGEESN